MSDKKERQIIDTCESDRKWLEEHGETIDMLTGMVEELFVENKAMLLSPVMRQLLIDKARLVSMQRQVFVGQRYLIDNPGESLRDRFETRIQ